MRETNSDTPKHWITSTNRPYQLLAAAWITLGLILIGMVILQYASRFFFQFLSSSFNSIGLLLVEVGAIIIIGASLLFYDSRSIHRNPFPEGSRCQIHPDQYAYDFCAICGKLYCPQDLVRIKQKTWGFSPGMFGFDGVACQNCAKHRIKQSSIISIILIIMIILLPVFNSIWLPTIFLIQLIEVYILFVGPTIIGLVLVDLLLLERLWRRVITPLTKNPEQMKNIEERLTERSIEG